MKDQKRDSNDIRADGGLGKNKNFVPMDQLTDTPARMFRMIIEKLKVGRGKWTSYMTDHLVHLHPNDSGTPAEVKKARSTKMGNVNSEFFFSSSLSFNKLIEGLKILKVKKFTVRLECELENGETFEVSETSYLRPSKSVSPDSKGQ